VNTYLHFFRRSPRFLTYGFALVFFSSFGQTFLVSLFGADFRREFSLSHGTFGLLYSLATLASALTLATFGKLIDHVPLPRFTTVVCLGLSAACLLMGVAHGAWQLAVAFFAVRVAGQGFSTHTAVTSMARYFAADRGKAISVAMLGFPAGQALLPLPMVWLDGRFGWRATWLGVGVVLAVGLVPLALWLLRGHADRHRRHTEATRAGAAAEARPSWSRRQVVRDGDFYRVLPALLTPTFVLTGLFFHQAHLADAKGWSLAWLASCFIGLSVTQVLGSLGVGPLVDRFGAPRLLRFFLLPLVVGLLFVAGPDHPVLALGYLTASGFTLGAGGTIGGALWAEAYGVGHLGAIRSMTSAITVFSTAASPVTMGWLIDRGVSMEAIAAASAVWTVLAAALAATAFGRLRGTRAA
jgi:MFS family permease